MQFAVALLAVICLQCACAAQEEYTDDPDCWVFRQKGRAISGNNDKVLRDVPSEDACAQACLDESEFDCASMEYKTTLSKCFLSTATRASAGSDFVASRGMVYKERSLPCGEEEEVIVVFGDDVVDRAVEDGSTYATVIPQRSRPIESDSRVIGASFYASRPGKMFIQVYRDEGDNNYSLVGEFQVEAAEAGVHTVELLSDQQFEVLAGDVFGLRFDGPTPIPFDIRYDENTNLLLTDSGPQPVGATVAFSESTTERSRTYSFQVSLAQ